MKEKLKLQSHDFKLLAYLYHHNREPLTKIAKAIGLTRQQVEYRLEKYLKYKLIKQFATIINYPALGLTQFVIILIKASTYTCLPALKQRLQQNEHCIAFGEIQGAYDLYINLICKDETSLKKTITFITEKGSTDIADYLVIKPTLAETYPIKFLDKKEDKPFIIFTENVQQVSLDKKEKEILKLLATNARIPLIEVAGKCAISAERALYTIKKLQRGGVIQGTKIVFNMQAFGYFYTVVLFHITEYSETLEIKLKNFARHHPHINSLGLTLTKPNCFLQIFHKTDEEVRTTLHDLKRFLQAYRVDYTLLNILEEEQANTLPSL